MESCSDASHYLLSRQTLWDGILLHPVLFFPALRNYQNGKYALVLYCFQKPSFKRWPNARNMLRPTMLRYVELACCYRLAGALGLSQQHPTCRNILQHGGQTHATCCVQMLRYVALTSCNRLAGTLQYTQSFNFTPFRNADHFGELDMG